MTVARSIRILARLTFPNKVFRLVDASGPLMDLEGNVWLPAKMTEGLDTIEHAMNGEALSFNMGLSGVDPDTANLAWEDHEAGNVIGSKVQLLIQKCDEWDQPTGLPRVRFTGSIDNLAFKDAVVGDQVQSGVVVEVVNRFTLRNTTNGQVLSDADQKARSAILNPGAPADRICERITMLADKTIRWPVART